jgi:hypothetical protein
MTIAAGFDGRLSRGGEVTGGVPQELGDLLVFYRVVRMR